MDITKENFLGNFLKFPRKNILIILFLIGFGEWFVSDIIHFSGGSFGFFFICLLGYFYFKNDKPKFKEPKDIKGWVNICNDDLSAFDQIEEKNDSTKNNLFRRNSFNSILNNNKNQRITVLGDKDKEDYKALLDKYFLKSNYELKVFKEPPSLEADKQGLPEYIKQNEAIFYHLNLPLTAKSLLWLKKFPEDMPVWLLISLKENQNTINQLSEFKSEIPIGLRNRIINFDIELKKLDKIPLTFRTFIIHPKKNIENTKIRLLRELHFNWQAEIETLRRFKLKEIQRKNQLMVAASVFASPLPSIDVLSMTVLNSLMINEIKEVWGCKWSPEILEQVSKQILKTAIAQGVIEWSGQALLNLSKIHGPNWLLVGSMQAISASYLTRVVSRSLADFMAISKGVTEPDLEFIKSNSDKIVENAFQSEKINWKSLISDMQGSLKYITS